MLQQFMSLSPDCTQRALPAVKLVQQPAHGNTTTEVVEGFPSFPPPTLSLHATPEDTDAAAHPQVFTRIQWSRLPHLTLTDAAKPAQTLKYAVHVNCWRHVSGVVGD
jgi:hypothetical protein